MPLLPSRISCYVQAAALAVAGWGCLLNTTAATDGHIERAASATNYRPNHAPDESGPIQKKAITKDEIG